MWEQILARPLLMRWPVVYAGSEPESNGMLANQGTLTNAHHRRFFGPEMMENPDPSWGAFSLLDYPGVRILAG